MRTFIVKRLLHMIPLLFGVSFAKAAAAASTLPLVAVHHLAGHIESLVLQNGELPLPSVVLVVSGGHTSLYLVERVGSYQLLSRTRVAPSCHDAA